MNCTMRLLCIDADYSDILLLIPLLVSVLYLNCKFFWEEGIFIKIVYGKLNHSLNFLVEVMVLLWSMICLQGLTLWRFQILTTFLSQLVLTFHEKEWYELDESITYNSQTKHQCLIHWT